MRVSLMLVANSMMMAPTHIKALRIAIENDEPIILCSRVVSVVIRDMMSPLPLVSK